MSQRDLWLIVCVCILCVIATRFLTRHVPLVAPEMRIACIDSLKIKNTAEPFVKVRNWFEDQRQNTQLELSNKIHTLQKTYEWLKVSKKDQKSRERHQEFQQELAGLERVVQERKDQLTQQFSVIASFLEEKLKQVIAQLAREKHVSLVMNQHINEIQSILYSDDSVIDITEDVVRLMNQETQNLHLPNLSKDLASGSPNESKDKS